MINATMPVSTPRCSATATEPLPPRSSSRPTTAAERHSLVVGRRHPPGPDSNPSGSPRPRRTGSRDRRAAGSFGSMVDRQVRGAPEEVHDPETGPRSAPRWVSSARTSAQDTGAKSSSRLSGAMALWETVIGLECHVELSTATKMFCGCAQRVRRGAEHERVPGVPGPARDAPGPERGGDRIHHQDRPGARLGDRAALAVPPEELLLSGHAEELPDLQYDLPICVGGHLDVELAGRLDEEDRDHPCPHGGGHRQDDPRGESGRIQAPSTR